MLTFLLLLVLGWVGVGMGCNEMRRHRSIADLESFCLLLQSLIGLVTRSCQRPNRATVSSWIVPMI